LLQRGQATAHPAANPDGTGQLAGGLHSANGLHAQLQQGSGLLQVD
jgi:hypothetical protein